MTDVPEPKAEAFVEALIALCRAHGFALEHEDGEGGFLVRRFEDEEDAEINAQWLRDAQYTTKRVH